VYFKAPSTVAHHKQKSQGFPGYTLMPPNWPTTEGARPLGATNEFIPEPFRSPDTPSKELDSQAVLDLTSTPPKTNGCGNQSNDSVLDLISPDKNPRKGTDEAVTDRVTSPTNLNLKFSENDSGEGGAGASKDTAPNAGERQDG
jgi:hypothetical protein